MPTDEWADINLFPKIEFRNYSWTRYKDGTTLGGFGIETTPREMAKLALCVADSGLYKGTRVVSAQWIKEMTTARMMNVFEEYDFGYQWWIDPGRCIQFMNGSGELT